MSSSRGSTPALARLFGSAIIDQAMLSAANLAAGLLLIRYASETQYGYYILAFNAMMLLTTLQGTFIGTPVVVRLPSLDAVARRQWMGSLLRDQLRLAAWAAPLALAGVAGGWALGVLSAETAGVAAAALLLILAALYREYLRGILLMYQRPQQVLAADVAYVLLLLGGVGLAVQGGQPASGALLAAAVASLVCAALLRRRLGSDIDAAAPRGRLREIARVGFWAASGGVIYWLFNQGYNFLTAATLDLTAVAALAATRLTLMPINLLLAGLQKQLAPLASGWVHAQGAYRTLRRLVLFSLGLALFTLLFGAVLWWLREWIFLDVMRKDFAQRDALLLWWIALFVLMVLREPVMMLLVVRQRFRVLSGSALICAVLALGISYAGMLAWGPVGAAIGIVAGEACYGAVVGWLAWREARADRQGPARP